MTLYSINDADIARGMNHVEKNLGREMTLAELLYCGLRGASLITPERCPKLYNEMKERNRRHA